MVMNTFTDKVLIVTGGGSGIGAATAQVIAKQGGTVVVSDLVLDGATTTVNRIRDAGGRAVAIQSDVTIPADAERTVAMALEQFGALHGAVNNAGHPSSGLAV